jgi:hypothetical protein
MGFKINAEIQIILKVFLEDKLREMTDPGNYTVAIFFLKSLPLQLASVCSAFITRNLLKTNKITKTHCQINVSIIFKFNFIL